MAVLTRETHESQIVLQNRDFTVLVLIRETIESLLVWGANGTERRIDDDVLKIVGRGESLGIGAAEDSPSHCRAARQAIGDESSKDPPAGLRPAGQSRVSDCSHSNPEREMP